MRGREKTAAALGLGLVLAVVIAAAGIRLETGIPGLRVAHRLAASLEVLVVLWLAWTAWRRPPVRLALALTALLSVVGILAGQDPPPAAAAVNLVGGLSLVATFAWILGAADEKGDEKGSGPFSTKRVLTPFLVLLASQLALGGWLTLVDRYGIPMALHGLAAVALTALLVWFAGTRSLLFVLALGAPLAGFTALHYEYSALAAMAHAAAAAFLLAAAAHAVARFA